MEWAVCICVVSFDEDYGHMVEVCYPPVLSETLQRSVAALSLPDSNAFNFLSEVSYVFRLRDESSFYFGHVYFKQSRDDLQARGFTQKSLVLLTALPSVDLFKGVLARAGPLYFSHGPSFIEVLWATIQAWPQPLPCAAQALAYFGCVREWVCPVSLELTEVNYYPCFGSDAIEHLWLIWESILIGEPVLIVADDAMMCSEAVLQMIDLIHPLQYKGDYRPFFSLLDPDFKHFISDHDQKLFKPVLIGMTNPISLKIFADWPLILQLKRQQGRVVLESVRSKRTSAIGPVHSVLNSLVSKHEGASESINSSRLRNHFYELTLHLLSPLVTFQDCQLRFDDQEFLRSLLKPELMFPLLRFTSRSKAVELYTRFVQTDTFKAWLCSV